MFFPDNYRYLPLPDNWKMDKEIQFLRKAAQFVIEQRINNKTRKYENLTENDFLETVLAHAELGTKRKSATDKSYLEMERPMDGDEVLDQVMNFIVAGFLPTGRLIEFSVMMLGTYPD